ncbi:NUDIX domain-containing protein [Anabaena azotica]|uniref:NUDIX domain-containing protein n=1 Tax=Anabaena azotica FACHB-119 TaxID=947527 RepID=A0ABR8D5M8_9NOST|nr:NUDIX domain-containing protein [Anabaena azotica]MBD2501748.1 NUDIX domain-containing protein [Anabaena azotica FACHB-119]
MIEGVDYIGVGVGSIIVNDQGLLFLAKRGRAARNERGMWEFPGGSVQFGETLIEAIKREIFEEYGLEIEIKELLGVFDHILPEENEHWVSITYIASLISGEAKICEPEKCEAIGWFSRESLPQPLSKITQLNLYKFNSDV